MPEWPALTVEAKCMDQTNPAWTEKMAQPMKDGSQDFGLKSHHISSYLEYTPNLCCLEHSDLMPPNDFVSLMSVLQH